MIVPQTRDDNELCRWLVLQNGHVASLGARSAATLGIAEAHRRGMIGCLLDVEGQPEWARNAARLSRRVFEDQCRCRFAAEQAIGSDVMGIGKGKRAVNFQHAMRLDPRLLSGSQDFNNCTAWTVREGVGCCLAVDIVANKEAHEYKGRPGTAGIYGWRGSRSDSGMVLWDGADAVHNKGIGLELDYGDGIDLRRESDDERAGVRWGASGPPQRFREAVKDDRIEQVSLVTSEEAVKDILYLGHFVATGSTTTARSTGDPVSEAGYVGGHAQLLMGYDDTDEFREWYREKTGKRLNDWVGIFDQSWGDDWLRVNDWPEHLWGPRPGGAFVLEGSVVASRMLDTRYGEAIAMSRVEGFPMLELPDWGFEHVL